MGVLPSHAGSDPKSPSQTGSDVLAMLIAKSVLTYRFRSGHSISTTVELSWSINFLSMPHAAIVLVVEVVCGVEVVRVKFSFPHGNYNRNNTVSSSFLHFFGEDSRVPIW